MPCLPGNQSANITDFCDFLKIFGTNSTPYLIHILFVPALMTIIITLIDRYKEDSKWFTFNTAIINIIMGIAWELKRQPKMLNTFFPTVNLIWSVGKDLSQYSIFPLAFTRVFVLYFPDRYKKIFVKKFLFIFILSYNAILAYLSYLCNGGNISWNFGLYMAIDGFMLIATFSCSFLVLLKIRKMMKLVGDHSPLNTFDDLRRAVFVCLFQACFYAIYTLLLCYMNLYNMGIIHNSGSNFLMVLLRMLTELQNPMFLLFVILDTLIPMVVLKSYRKTIRKVCLKGYFLIRYMAGMQQITVKVLMPLNVQNHPIMATQKINNLVHTSV